VHRVVAATPGNAPWDLLHSRDGQEVLRVARGAQPAIVLLDISMSKLTPARPVQLTVSTLVTTGLGAAMVDGQAGNGAFVRTAPGAFSVKLAPDS
jgi:CheY-like chemotaxis protein